MVLTRPGEDRDLGQVFHVYRQPLPNALINLEEIPDGEAAGGGTFRGAFTGGNDKGSTSQEYTIILKAYHIVISSAPIKCARRGKMMPLVLFVELKPTTLLSLNFPSFPFLSPCSEELFPREQQRAL